MHDLVSILTAHGVSLVFAAVLAARIGAPVPASPLLVVAGALAAAGQIGLPAVVLASVVANLAGDGLWFQAGRRYGRRVMRLLCKVSMSPDTCVRQSESLIGRWGGSSLVAAKFVPGVSVVAAPMAGALGMSWPRFIGYDTFAALVWTAAFLALGWAFSGQIEVALTMLASAGGAAAAGVVVLAALWLGWRWWRRRRLMRHSAVPRIGVGELQLLMSAEVPPVVIDVRGDALATQRIPGALAITLAELPARLPGLPRDREVVLYCDCPNEVSAALGALALMQAGIPSARALTGGLEAWAAAGLPLHAAKSSAGPVDSLAPLAGRGLG